MTRSYILARLRSRAGRAGDGGRLESRPAGTRALGRSRQHDALAEEGGLTRYGSLT